jgi:thiosulfate reductase cytochrome b subunit
MTRVFIYKRFERFWHWMQALLVILLAMTGFVIHFHWPILSWETAVWLHKVLAWSFVVLIAFAIFWHFTTGEWRQYLPGTGNIAAMMRFYTIGIFRSEPHPVKKTARSKLNPLQKLAYLGLKILVIPVLVTTGFLYYYVNEWKSIGLIADWPLLPIALIHTFAAYAMIAFMFGHVYLTTTGHTVLSNLKAMITGWEELEADDATASPAANAGPA